MRGLGTIINSAAIIAGGLVGHFTGRFFQEDQQDALTKTCGVTVLSGSIILIQSFVPGAAAVLKQLTKLNSVCMPMRYLWVFTAYIALRKAGSKFSADYRFVRNDKLALLAGGWCFFVTAACCLLGVYDLDPFTMCLNIITPCVLTALGIILPVIKKRELAKTA